MKQSVEPLGFITCSDEKDIDRADKEIKRDYAFKVVSPERTFYITAESEYVAESWVYALKQACNRYAVRFFSFAQLFPTFFRAF